MLIALPEKIDPLRAARQELRMQGSLAPQHLYRVCEHFAAPPCEPVVVDWHFYVDERKRAKVEGTVQTTVQLICQRCLEPMSWPLVAQTRLCFLPAGQPEDDDMDFEVVAMESALLGVVDLIEDELLLALPIVALHPTCPYNERITSQPASQAMPAENPFAVLKSLLDP